MDATKAGREPALVSTQPGTLPEASPRIQSGETYLPQLDGIRALAVLLVLASHYLPVESLVSRLAEWGRMGVVLFFTLSGYLITGILLRYRDYRLEPGGSLGRGLGVFYARRFLRIFPIYYLSLVVLFAAGYEYVRKPIVWHLTYTSNVSLAYFGGLYGYSVHLWSLCVEEQFYLVWPCVVMFVPKRMLPRLALTVLPASVLFKGIGMAAGLSLVSVSFTPFGCLDSLALGSCLAIFRHEYGAAGVPTRRLVQIGIGLGSPLFAMAVLARLAMGVSVTALPLYAAASDLATALAFLPFLFRAAQNGSGWMGRTLSWAPARYLGKISYGVYMYHFFMVPACLYLGSRLGFTLPDRGIGMLAMATPLTILLAAVSWHVLEAPINGLKRHFNFDQSRRRLEAEEVHLKSAA